MTTIIEDVNNVAYISGTIATAFKCFREYRGEKFYEIQLDIKSKNGKIDKIPVIIPNNQLRKTNKIKGDRIAIKGEIRTCRIAKKLKVFIFAQNIYEAGVSDINKLQLTGYLCKEVVYAETPNGRRISDMILAVNRKYRKSDYIPCVCREETAVFVSKLSVGDKLKVDGRIQSREYIKEGETKTALEVAVYKVET